MRIVTWQDGIIQIYSWLIVAMLLVIAASFFAVKRSYSLLCDDNKTFEINGFYPILNLSKFWHLVIFYIVIGLIVGLAYTGANPFIYFQF
jgi:alginate O-acetyltransferase complex protein AlgI